LAAAGGGGFNLRQRFRARGEDLREMPLVERKARLKKLIREQRRRMLYVDHIEGRGCEFVPLPIKWQRREA